MAKRTAVIDIGSNSARMVVFEKTSRYAFHLLKEVKSKVRISEGTYENNSLLQLAPSKRAQNALFEFSKIAKSLKCTKILCVATSAIREAPNRGEFIKNIKEKTQIGIKIIDGQNEANLGAIAALNLLPDAAQMTTIDIGGGSTEFAKIVNKKIVKTISLNIGTIRLKELFFDKEKSFEQIEEFIEKELLSLDDTFLSPVVVAIGGTSRAITKTFMNENYPLPTIHGYEYETSKRSLQIEKIAKSPIDGLYKLGIKKDRYDTIREGASILFLALRKLNAKKVITSGVGVREGVYLKDILRSSNFIFPQNFQPSVRSIKDRFLVNQNVDSYNKKMALSLFEILKPLHSLNDNFKKELGYAAEICTFGRVINYYKQDEIGFEIILNSLNYGFSHKEKTLIAFLVKFSKKGFREEDKELENFAELLPTHLELKWLSFMVALSKCINSSYDNPNCTITLENRNLIISSETPLYLCQEEVLKLNKPIAMGIVFRNFY